MPKSSKANREARASLKRAFIKVASSKPWLLTDAFERGLSSGRPLGYLDLAARLLKEIQANESTAPQIAIVFNGSLDATKLKDVQPVAALIQAPPEAEVVESK